MSASDATPTKHPQNLEFAIGDVHSGSIKRVGVRRRRGVDGGTPDPSAAGRDLTRSRLNQATGLGGAAAATGRGHGERCRTQGFDA
jgi:hypothetical protein